jgi:hypothetical protein
MSVERETEVFISKFEETLSLQQDILEQDLETLIDLHNLTPLEITLSKEYLEDLVSIFKFFRRAQWNRIKAKELIMDTVLWRIGSPVSAVGPTTSVQNRLRAESLAYLRLSELNAHDKSPLKLGLFYFLPGARDKFGRPVAVMNLQYLTGADDVEGFKEYVALSVEVGRRLCWEETLRLWEEKGKGKDAVIRYACILDLKGVSISVAVPLLASRLTRHRMCYLTLTTYFITAFRR